MHLGYIPKPVLGEGRHQLVVWNEAAAGGRAVQVMTCSRLMLAENSLMITRIQTLSNRPELPHRSPLTRFESNISQIIEHFG
jgi:hypothetical protein